MGSLPQTGRNGQPANGQPAAKGHGHEPARLDEAPRFQSERLVIARRRLAMSQGELASRLGVDQSTVSRLERGEMQSPPWRLVVQACLHLHLEPQALMDVNSGPSQTCRPLSIVRARVSHHFLHLGPFGRLPEMLHYCLHDISHVRPTIAGISLLLFDWPDGVTRLFYAHWNSGQVTFAEHLIKRPLQTAAACMQAQWRDRKASRRTVRPELPGWEPQLVYDQPLTRGMLGLDFSAEESVATDTDFWVARLAETFDQGLSLVGERFGHEQSAEMRDIVARVMALEQKVH